MLFRSLYASALRRATGLPVIAVGLITSAEQAEAILRAGQADLVAMGRELLRTPHFALAAAQRLQGPARFPRQYERAYA